jgi:hypothetical protein
VRGRKSHNGPLAPASDTRGIRRRPPHYQWAAGYSGSVGKSR